jgi:hypothetical protein
MTETRQLELPFRGERSYLHGTDLYQALSAAVPELPSTGPVSLNFHQLLRNQPDLVLSRESLLPLRENPAFRGEIRWGAGEELWHAALLESDRPVTARKACNEAEVAAAASVDVAAKTAVLNRPAPGLPIEQVVFLNKRLHLEVLPHLSPKWLFARLELVAPLPDVLPDGLTISLRQVLGNRFTRSEITAGGERLGFISFSTPQ